MLLSTAFFPPVEYFAAIAKGMTLSADKVVPSKVCLEACENYQKQSYRNRCLFYAENGVQAIQVPVVHERGTHELPISEIKVDYSTPWLIRSQRAIDSAYESSAFFEYYRDDLFALMDLRPEKLFDLNISIIEFFLKKTGIAADIELTKAYVPYGTVEEDYRSVIHPKRPNTILEDMGLKKPYFQVFACKHGFISNLSIMDLLFNEGPESIVYLKKF